MESKRYTESLFNGQGSKAKIALRKLTWSMYRAEDALKLEQRLQSHLDALHRYLTAVSIQTQVHTAQRADNKLERMNRTLDEVHTFVKISQENRPKMLGYPWETDIESHIKFEDALGRKLILPDVLCQSAQSFQDTVQIMFANHPGFRTIVEGNYEIIDTSTNSAILSPHSAILRPSSNSLGSDLNDVAFQTRWRAHVLPGTNLAMNIINKRRLRGSPDSLVPAVPTEVPCPDCGWNCFGHGLRKW